VRRSLNPRGDWLAGCVLGTWAGFCAVYVPAFGLILFVVFAVPALIFRSLPAMTGLLFGTGSMALLVIALANWSCAQDNARAGESCTSPDLTGFLVAGSAMAIAGGILTVRAIRGHHPSTRERDA
jgi:hypothetical protein